MKCINMKVVDILFFIASFLTINSSLVKQDKTAVAILKSKDVDLKKKFSVDLNCPHLAKMIRDNNLTNYTINCKTLDSESHITEKENVLQHSCVVVNNIIINYVCNKNFNETILDLLGRNNTSDICPFKLSHLEQFNNIFRDHEIVKNLTIKDFCQRICYGVFTTEYQCILLNKFSNYIKISQKAIKTNSTYTGTDRSLAKPDTANIDHEKVVKTKGGQTNQNQTKLPSIKEITTNFKTETAASRLTDSVMDSTKQEKRTERPVMTSESKQVQLNDDGENSKIEELESGLDNDKFKTKSDNEPLIEDGFDKKEESLPKPDLTNQDLVDSGEPMPKETKIIAGEGFSQADDSHFFFYFIMVSSVIVVGYLAFHNKNKILAYALEGSSGRRNRRRPNPARYRKLETNLEEAMSSNTTNAATSSVVY